MNINAWRGKSILVVGDFMLDKYVFGKAERISPESPVPVLRALRLENRLGGAGNVVRNLVSLGANVSLAGCWGDDADGLQMLEMFRELGADTSRVRVDANLTTIVKTRLVADNHHLLRVDDDTPLPPYCTPTEGVFDAVVLSDYGKGTITGETTRLFTGVAPVIVDPKGTDFSKYAGATVCTPNTKELVTAFGRPIVGEEELRIAALSLCENAGIRYMAVTRAEKGISLIGRDGKANYPAVAQEVIDVTGAGDTVVSVFALGLAAGLDMSEICKIANLAASVVVSRFGASVVTFGELSAKLSDDKTLNTDILDGLRVSGKKIVFTNGCFDLVHAGHIKAFEQAKAMGDVLVVGLNSDRSVTSLKGPPRPIVSQDNRAKLLRALSCVDYVVVFDEDTPERLIRDIKPDVLVKGADWRGKTVAGQEFVEANGGRVAFIELEQGLSTTNIVAKIRE
ncbi:bifunctional protein HldE [Clostridia bacterium]|nr:bifunctional protein HldE [Clostridia bacterium]